jgi:transposase
MCERSAPGFAAVTVAPGASSASVIEVEFASGARLRIAGPVDAPTVSAAITALARGVRQR